MPTWPSTLPQLVRVDGFSERPPATVIRTTTELGPGKARRRGLYDARTLSLTLDLTGAQLATFDAFLITTIAGGALPFDFTHPRTGVVMSMRLLNDGQDRVEYQAKPGGMRWLVPIRLQVMP